MLDVYFKFIDGKATDDELNDANKQLEELIKGLGMGFLVLLPFSPVTIPYLVKKAKSIKLILFQDGISL